MKVTSSGDQKSLIWIDKQIILNTYTHIHSLSEGYVSVFNKQS